MWIGLILSYIFVFAIIFIATIIQKTFRLSPEVSRKIIHIGVGNWIFFVPYLFQDWTIAIIPPASFVIINYFSYKYSIFKAMELEEKNPGTVYYSISLMILTFFTFGDGKIYYFPYLGVLAMVWGDGMAAVIGKRWPIKELRAGKSLGGSLAFLIFSIFALSFYLLLFNQFNFIILSIFTIIGMLIELYSPKNLDNLTVPLALGVMGYLTELLIL